MSDWSHFIGELTGSLAVPEDAWQQAQNLMAREMPHCQAVH